MRNVLLAGLLGGLAMYVWTSIAHMATPLAEIGIQTVASDDGSSSLQAVTGDKPGFFFFPAVGDMKTPEDMAAYDKKTQTMPSGIMIYHPAGQGIGFSPEQLAAEFVKELAQALFAAFLLSLTAIAAYLSRVALLSLFGICCSLTTNVSYLIWYGFPLDYTLAYMTIEIVGFIVAAFVIAAMVRPRAA